MIEKLLEKKIFLLILFSIVGLSLVAFLFFFYKNAWDIRLEREKQYENAWTEVEKRTIKTQLIY